MKRFLLALFVVAAGVAGVAGYSAASRDREYRRLVADGDTALKRDDSFFAVEAFSAAIGLKPDSMLAYLRRGEAYRRRGELQAARRDLRTAVELDPGAPRALEALGDVQYAMRQYERAADRYGDCLRLDDTSPRVQYKLGLAQYHAGRPAAAVPPLTRAAALDPTMAEAEYVLGLALRDLLRTGEALRALSRAVALSPALVEARAELAAVYGSLGRTTDEIQQLEALAALSPRPERSVALGLAYARDGRINQAVLTLGRAAERFPDNAQIYVTLGRVWLDLAETRHDRIALSKATEALEAALSTADPSSEALALFGRALYLQPDLTTAEQTLIEATERLPVDPISYVYLAEASERLGHIARARDALVDFRALVGDSSPEARRIAPPVRIAELSVKIGDAPSAVTWYRRASEAAPSDARLLGRLAVAAWTAGDHPLARTSLTRALELAPADPALRSLQRRIH